MSLIDEIACPGEGQDGGSAHGPIQDEETIVLALRQTAHYRRSHTGKAVVAMEAIDRDDLEGKPSKRGQRGVSIEREGCCTPGWLLDRMRALTGQQDPVIARGDAANFRRLLSKAGQRDVCLLAEPDEGDDKFARSETHGVIRACPTSPKPPVKEATSWLNLRAAVAEAFTIVEHLQSKREPS